MAWREDAHISTVRVRGAGQDSPALRLGLATLLGGADFRPPGVPPSAVLIVRRLADPLPGRLAKGRSPARVDRVWERALQQRLANLYRQAARPAQGRLPPNAEAILFADESEMLAGLALDLSRGEAARRWWWRVPLRRLPAGTPSERIGVLLCREAARVPAALHLLSTWKQAEPVVRALSPARAATVLRAVGVAFDVASLDAAPPRRAGSANATQTAHSTAGTAAHRVEEAQHPGLRIPDPVRPPWTGHLAPNAVPTGLEPAQQRLLGVSLMLHRAPAQVRQPAFLQALQQGRAQEDAPVFRSHQEDRPQHTGQPEVWETQADHSVSDAPRAQRIEKALQPEVSRFDHSETSSRAEARTPDEALMTTPRSVQADDPQAIDPRVVAGQHRHLEQAAEATPAPTKPQQPPSASPNEQQASDPRGPSSSIRDDEKDLDTAPGPEAPSLQDAEAASQALPEDEDVAEVLDKLPLHEHTDLGFEAGVDTQLGGVLYLINLMIHLDLPGCFEAAWRLDREVGPWGLLEVLARAFAPPDRPDLAGDPLWACLAALDGREAGTLPGADYRGSDHYRLPTAWFAQAGLGAEDGYGWATRAGRLRVWSSEGFVVAALPRDAEAPAAQARAILEALDAPPGYALRRRAFDAAPLETLAGPFVAGFNPSLASWAAFVMPYLRHRLGRALALAPADRAGLAKTLLLHTGCLYLTSSHIDLVMPLEAISMPVRMAGLDRDPGWLPSFGRVVYLHFE